METKQNGFVCLAHGKTAVWVTLPSPTDREQVGGGQQAGLTHLSSSFLQLTHMEHVKALMGIPWESSFFPEGTLFLHRAAGSEKG